MQRLGFANRAVKFGELKENREQSEPGPLRNSTKLDLDRVELEKAFEDILTRYAGNIRSIWPDVDDKQGLFYDMFGIRTVNAHDRARRTRSAGKDVRVDEVRFCLVGASVEPDGPRRQRILVHIVDYSGYDMFEDVNHHRLEFSHDMASIPFAYDTALVRRKRDLTSRAKLSQQNALRDSWTGGWARAANSIAAVGPFTTWRLVVRESENLGLDMSEVATAHVEFRGANRSFKYK
ncbi:hypothetical protein BDV36DRAFT_289892 [Aspergillus pseudocaelatus]|uniref:SnoaL-like domain-containing protein n=1 Tax=Aspergillus pseudocaelatus TaxID=1825620 RepID=A0ABQ6X384_9EURO|nr:hypothetical protein BDV36DRAFT_289892 [Aspergillus pseudocaelatus]